MESYMGLIFSSDRESLMTAMNGVDIFLDEKLLGQILDIPTEGVNSVENQVALRKFLTLIGKKNNLNKEMLLKKKLKGSINSSLN